MMHHDVLQFQVGAEQFPSEQFAELYKALITEEYDELKGALEHTDQAHILNEAMDLIWVILGYCNIKGFDVEGAWMELTRANLSKLQADPVTGKLLRRPDGKIKKPENWQAPNFEPFLPYGGE